MCICVTLCVKGVCVYTCDSMCERCVSICVCIRVTVSYYV